MKAYQVEKTTSYGTFESHTSRYFTSFKKAKEFYDFRIKSLKDVSSDEVSSRQVTYHKKWLAVGLDEDSKVVTVWLRPIEVQ